LIDASIVRYSVAVSACIIKRHYRERLRRTANNPAKPLPISQTAAGTGTGDTSVTTMSSIAKTVCSEQDVRQLPPVKTTLNPLKKVKLDTSGRKGTSAIEKMESGPNKLKPKWVTATGPNTKLNAEDPDTRSSGGLVTTLSLYAKTPPLPSLVIP
jgi:hypothetical protein